MEKSPIILSQNHDDQVREIVYTANGEKITNEDSPLRNSDLVQLVGFTTYSNTLGDDGYELLLSRKRKLSHGVVCEPYIDPHFLEPEARG